MKHPENIRKTSEKHPKNIRKTSGKHPEKHPKNLILEYIKNNEKTSKKYFPKPVEQRYLF
jgi:hypothetical protein